MQKLRHIHQQEVAAKSTGIKSKWMEASASS